MTFPWMVNFFNPQRDQIRLSFDGRISNTTSWVLTNNTSVPIKLVYIWHSWPVAMDAVFNFILDGSTIWSSEDLNPPTIVPDEADWFGAESNRIVAPKDTVDLDVFYGVGGASTGFELILRFENGWEISAVG